jgi:hypothetical protein
MSLDRKQKHFQKQKWKKKYFSSSTNNRHVFLSNANSIALKTFETIDEMSRSNCFANNDSANCAEFSIVKNAQNFLKKKIVATVERTLKRKKSFKSLSRDIDKISNMLLWVHLNSWHATSSLWTTLMLELDDEWFLIKSYLEILYRYSSSIFTC